MRLSDLNKNSISQAGTSRYMSPELLDRYADIKDVQSFISIDIYALSLVLWEVLNRTAIDSSFKPGRNFTKNGPWSSETHFECMI